MFKSDLFLGFICAIARRMHVNMVMCHLAVSRDKTEGKRDKESCGERERERERARLKWKEQNRRRRESQSK